MDAKGAIYIGALLALLFATSLFLVPIMDSPSDANNTNEDMETATRFLYAGVMTFAPTSEVAVAIDVGAAVVASFGLVKSASHSVKGGLIVTAFLYFFISFVVNFAAAPF